MSDSNIRQDYPIGARVELTEAALRNGIGSRRANKMGTVHGYSWKHPGCLWVRQDGVAAPGCYHRNFWQLSETAHEDNALLVANA